MALLARGVTQAEVARQCEVSTPTALRWRRALEAKGKAAWKRRPLGQPPKIQEAHREALRRFLTEGAQAHGFTNDLWTLPRIAAVLEQKTGLRIHPGHLWRVLIQLGWSVQKPEKRATQRDETAIARWKRHTWPALKKKAAAEGRTIVFVDESGLSERPTVVRTWAPVGQTPQLEFSFRWNHLSVIAGVTWWNFYFRLHQGAIRGPQAAEFLGQIHRQIRRPLLVIWDGLAVHRSRKVKAFLERHPGQVHLAQLPGYAPELNPVEYLWGHLKQHGLANFCPRDLGELGAEARRKLRRMRAKPTLVRAFWKQADLSL